MPTSSVCRSPGIRVYLIDTHVISEARKGTAANPGVLAFFRRCAEGNENLYLSAVTIGEP